MHAILNVFLLLSSILLCVTSSPVAAIIYLILAFVMAAIILFMFHIEFIALVFIIVYVGAIAVLFLFVIMMLNIKSDSADETKTFSFKYIKIVNSVLAIILLIFAFFFMLNFDTFNKYIANYLKDYYLMNYNDDALIYFIDEVSNVEIVGQILFNNYLVCVLIAGLILLVSLIGSIILTLKFDKIEKKQIINKQLARNENFIVFFK